MSSRERSLRRTGNACIVGAVGVQVASVVLNLPSPQVATFGLLILAGIFWVRADLARLETKR